MLIEWSLAHYRSGVLVSGVVCWPTEEGIGEVKLYSSRGCKVGLRQ